MTDMDLVSLEQKAQEMERRLAVLELKATRGNVGNVGVNVQEYISELQSLKGVLLAAKTDQETLEQRVVEVRTKNLPKYWAASGQVAHHFFSKYFLCAPVFI